MTEQKPHIIVRVGKGSDTPLDPGHQHKANYIEEFKSMCKTIKIFDCKSPKEIKEAYHFANNNKGVYIINEYPEKYNDYGVLNIICDESSDYSNTNQIQNIFGEGWYEVTNYEICDRNQISLRKNENFYHIIVINSYLTSLYRENPILPLKDIRFLLNLDIMGSGEEGVTVVNSTLFDKEYQLLCKLNNKKKALKQIKGIINGKE